MPIRVLSSQLRNQISAGEIVERPASVVKEIVENSLDAGATCIDINIEHGGTKLIRIRDNGYGINKDELKLAVARHATSKISTLNDLESIESLGFRGEALASISAVSRLILTSRTATQTEAWQVYIEDCDHTRMIKPAAHPIGSTLIVLDLFYNTPARRKFMRTEKTEFIHIDEVVRRIALAYFDVTINLIHNGKRIRQYHAAKKDNQHEYRLKSILSPAFLQNILNVSDKNSEFSLYGWLAPPGHIRSISSIQYCYVNNRIIRDRLINHAIRQAYQTQCNYNDQPAYVFFLEVPPHQVDVNVHPTKDKVRFYQARLVHDFIYQAIARTLNQSGSSVFVKEKIEKDIKILKQNKPIMTSIHDCDQIYDLNHNHQEYDSTLYKKICDTDKYQNKTLKSLLFSNMQPTGIELIPNNSYSFNQVMMIYPPCYALIAWKKQPALINLLMAERLLNQRQLNPSEKQLNSQSLLIPIRLILKENEVKAIVCYQEILIKMGFDFHLDYNKIIIRTVPLLLFQQTDLQKIILDMLAHLTDNNGLSLTMIAIWLAQRLSSKHQEWNSLQAIQLLTNVERLFPRLIKSPPSWLLQLIDLQAALAAFEND